LGGFSALSPVIRAFPVTLIWLVIKNDNNNNNNNIITEFGCSAYWPTHPTLSVGFLLNRHVESKSRWCSVELHHEILASICYVVIQSNKKLRLRLYPSSIGALIS